MKNKVKVLIFIIILLIAVLGSIGILYLNGKVDKTLLYYLENEPVITQEKLREGESYYINIYKIIDSDIYYIQPRISEVGNCKFIKNHSQEFKLGE